MSMSPEELQVIVYGVAEIAALSGALAAVAVHLVLMATRCFSDWFLAREQAARRIAAARIRASLADASEEVPGRRGRTCEPLAHRQPLSASQQAI